MRLTKLILLITPFLLILGCGKSGPDYQQTERGLKYRIIERDDSAKSGKPGFIYLLDLDVHREDDSIVMSSHQIGRKLYFEWGPSVYRGDFNEAFSIMKKGDSLEVFQVADTFFGMYGKPLPSGVDSGETLRINIRVHDILNEMEHEITRIKYEETQINKYIEQKKWMNFYHDSLSDIRILHLENTDKEPVEIGDYVQIEYLYTLLDGTIIAKSKNNDGTKLTIGNNNHIEGLEKVLLQMRNGERVVAIIPFTEAFGEKGSAYIPPYTTLVAEIEITGMNDEVD